MLKLSITNDANGRLMLIAENNESFDRLNADFSHESFVRCYSEEKMRGWGLDMLNIFLDEYKEIYLIK